MSRRGKPPTVSQAERRGIQSVEISAIILAAIAEEGTALPLGRLSELTGMPSSKTHRYLASFIRTGLVRQDETTGRYDLGPAALRLGLSALSRFDVIEAAQTTMKRLTQELNITSLLSVWGPQGPTIIRWQRAPQALVTSLNLGSVLPVLSSSTGRIFLAHLPRMLTNDLASRELSANKRNPNRKNLITTKSEIAALIKKVRAAGVASVDSSVVPGLRAVAAPILDHQGEASAVITLIGSESFLNDTLGKTATALKKACRSLSLDSKTTDE